MYQELDHFGEWNPAGLVDPRGQVYVEKQEEIAHAEGTWPITWSHQRVGLFSNRKPNADAMLQEVQRGLSELHAGLTFVYGSKEPLAEGAPEHVIQSYADCDVVVLASAECGGCTSWVCRDYITLEKLGIPCMVLATSRFEGLARSVLAAGGITDPHLLIPQHPVSGITGEQAQVKVRNVFDQLTDQMFGSAAMKVATA